MNGGLKHPEFESYRKLCEESCCIEKKLKKNPPDFERRKLLAQLEAVKKGIDKKLSQLQNGA